jgi:hypothetical protein
LVFTGFFRSSADPHRLPKLSVNEPKWPESMPADVGGFFSVSFPGGNDGKLKADGDASSSSAIAKVHLVGGIRYACAIPGGVLDAYKPVPWLCSLFLAVTRIFLPEFLFLGLYRFGLYRC